MFFCNRNDSSVVRTANSESDGRQLYWCLSDKRCWLPGLELTINLGEIKYRRRFTMAWTTHKRSPPWYGTLHHPLGNLNMDNRITVFMKIFLDVILFWKFLFQQDAPLSIHERVEKSKDNSFILSKDFLYRLFL